MAARYASSSRNCRHRWRPIPTINKGDDLFHFLLHGCTKCGQLRARAVAFTWKEIRVSPWSYPRNRGIQLELELEEPDCPDEDPYRYA